MKPHLATKLKFSLPELSGFFQSPNVIIMQKHHPCAETTNSETPGDSRIAVLQCRHRSCSVVAVADILSTRICSQHYSQNPTKLKPHMHHFNTQLWDLGAKGHDSWALLEGLASAFVSHSHYTQVKKRADEPCDVARMLFTPADARMCSPAVTKVAMG